MKPDYNIIEFFESSLVLNVKNLSPVQKVTLKAIMGQPLDTKKAIPKSHPYQDRGFDNEVELFKHFSGKDHYSPRFYSNPSLCFGRRSGKSTTVGAGLAIYFATQFDYTPYLGTSPHATIPIISPTKEQANEVYQAIKNFFLRSPLLYRKYLGGDVSEFQEEFSEDALSQDRVFTGGTIRLKGQKVVIKVMPADVAKIRGMAVPFAILDECCFFGVEGNDLKNTDRGIYEALSPALSQFKTVEGMAMVLKISSPNGQTGLMYEEFEACKSERVLHMQVPSWYANPTVSVQYLEEQKDKGMSFFNREYGAQYTASETSYLDPNLIDKMVIKGVNKIDYMPKFRYAAVMDYATKKDYWAFGIGHKEIGVEEVDLQKTKVERVLIDVLCHWKGDDGNELNPEIIVPQICNLLKEYKVPLCITDQYAFAALRPYFQKQGCVVKEFKISTQSKIKYFYSLQVGVNSEKTKMVHNPIAVKHLKDLREKRGTGTTHFKIEAAQGSHDDYANVIALIQYQFDQTSPIFIGTHRAEPDPGPPSKDAKGNQLLMPTASELAEHAGVHGFYDNRIEVEEEEEESSDNFWFIF